MTGLPRSKDRRVVEYDLILVIVSQLIKMLHYKPVTTKLNTDELAQVLIEDVMNYHGLPDSIVIDRGSIFTCKF